jgi:hypothetical protein
MVDHAVRVINGIEGAPMIGDTATRPATRALAFGAISPIPSPAVGGR